MGVDQIQGSVNVRYVGWLVCSLGTFRKVEMCECEK